MRVIGGEFRSRRLKSIPGAATRPTPDRLRETLFNILAPRIEGATFSWMPMRGPARWASKRSAAGPRTRFFWSATGRAVEAIRENLAALELRRRDGGGRAGAADAGAAPRRIVFLDPPYELEREYAAALETLGEAPPELVIAQHSVRLELGDAYGGLRRVRVVRQGDNALSFFAA